MIPLSLQFDLGRDHTRIKDPRDADRQARTAEEVLGRLFHADDEHRLEMQLVADEVGMGKTFVALAVAYSLLRHLDAIGEPPGLEGCLKKVLILTPGNAALFDKWQREVSEFVNRCVLPEFRKEAERWFRPEAVRNIEDLPGAMSGKSRVIVAHTGLLTRQTLRDYDLKRRYMLTILFAHWGRGFPTAERERLLRGAPESWPRTPAALERGLRETVEGYRDWIEDGREFLRKLDREDEHGNPSPVEELRLLCREIAEPFTRSRAALFKRVEAELVDLFKSLLAARITRDLPLVIVDEAHNWKNGPSNGANGYRWFETTLGPRTRRLLLLTATPFQLRPDEMLELAKIGEAIQPARDRRQARARTERMRAHRESVLTPVLAHSVDASGRFTEAWRRLPRTVDTEALAAAWNDPGVESARLRLRQLAHAHGLADGGELRSVAAAAVAGLDPSVRQLVRAGLELYAHNGDLSQELGRLVIRHRRTAQHRLFRVGAEYPRPAEAIARRPDRCVLHAAPGLDVHGDGELPHYLLMRCVAELDDRRGVTSLGSSLTGCYSTLLASAEWRKIEKWLAADAPGQRFYAEILKDMIGADRDPEHPKVQAVVERVIRAWRVGEKSLIFCFRTNTAERLRDILDERIRGELEARRARCLGDDRALKALRGRLSGRDRDLVPLGLDRVLWSFWWAKAGEGGAPPFDPAELTLRDDEIADLARLALETDGIDLSDERPDRVFIHRAVEHLVARRLSRERPTDRAWRALLDQVSDPDWVLYPYGEGAEGHDDADDADHEGASFDERGAFTIFELSGDEPSPRRVEALAKTLALRRERARQSEQVSILDTYLDGPSLWLGSKPRALALHEHHVPLHGDRACVAALHGRLWALQGDEGDWFERGRAVQALRRALLRESVLLRLLPERTEREQAGWGELLVDAFFRPLEGQRESMADRLNVFLEDLGAASGGIGEPGTARDDLWRATQLRDQQFVALVKGGTKLDTRTRIFAGFNTPLLPEVLIATSVGQEGIDLHRHCRHVIHYDLAWNPAVLEQRTGRADRIGSKTFREREGLDPIGGPYLEVGVPFLAGVYDERMYEELRLRAQTFEVLTGGELAADQPELSDEADDPEGKGQGLRFVPLPQCIVDDLRVDFAVWRPEHG